MLQDFPMYAYIPARDLERAREFYEKKVGLRAKEETNGGVVHEFAGGAKAAWFKDSEGNIMALVEDLPGG